MSNFILLQEEIPVGTDIQVTIVDEAISVTVVEEIVVEVVE